MKKIIVFGAGEIAQLAHFYFTRQREFEVCAFAVDDEYADKPDFCGLPLIKRSQMALAFPPERYSAFVAMSYARMNQAREEKFLELKRMGYALVSYISPQCTRLTDEIGENCFILEDNTLQPFSRIGNNVTLWSGNHIGHHAHIGDNAFITSHVVISGGVRIGKNCFIGVNATLRDHITLGEGTMVGAGAILIKDTLPKQVYRAPRSECMAITSDEIKKI
jgi:sugar O-acyltransferase (sialic acid O-acetyltransferase NeuD family)